MVEVWIVTEFTSNGGECYVGVYANDELCRESMRQNFDGKVEFSKLPGHDPNREKWVVFVDGKRRAIYAFTRNNVERQPKPFMLL